MMNPDHETSEVKEEGKSVPAHEHIEVYGGHIKAYHGRVNGWLLGVYTTLFVWSLYYLFNYWGGLGPGLDY